MALHKVFIVCDLLWFIGKDSGVVSRYFLRSFEFRITLLLNWVPPKAREANLLCYLSRNWGRRDFPKVVIAKVNTRIWTLLADSTFLAVNHKNWESVKNSPPLKCEIWSLKRIYVYYFIFFLLDFWGNDKFLRSHINKGKDKKFQYNFSLTYFIYFHFNQCPYSFCQRCMFSV